jgi:hypothetical protein
MSTVKPVASAPGDPRVLLPEQLHVSTIPQWNCLRQALRQTNENIPFPFFSSDDPEQLRPVFSNRTAPRSCAGF